MSVSKPLRGALRLTTDQAIGGVGVCLAVASAAFAVAMTMHGPVASLGTKDFTVFAQLGPRHIDRGARQSPAASGEATAEMLDVTPTASIPANKRASAAGSDARVISSVTLEAVGSDSATVAFEGETRVVRVGDEVPGAGEIIAILPGARPVLKTSRGLIVPAGE